MTAQERRHAAIESGMQNLADTVLVDKAITANQAWEALEAFVIDGLNCHGLCDEVTAVDIDYAKSLWCLQREPE